MSGRWDGGDLPLKLPTICAQSSESVEMGSSGFNNNVIIYRCVFNIVQIGCWIDRSIDRWTALFLIQSVQVLSYAVLMLSVRISSLLNCFGHSGVFWLLLWSVWFALRELLLFCTISGRKLSPIVRIICRRLPACLSLEMCRGQVAWPMGPII